MLFRTVTFSDDKDTSTVYCKSFTVEKFHGFRGLIGDREAFLVK